jgi:ABC-type multidrug transport system ATPase subunit
VEHPAVIEAIELSSVRRGRTALEQVSFDVYPGQVTALVGAAGSGKSTVLRMMAELEPCRGRTLYDGRPYHALHPAIREVGLALDPGALHPHRTVAGHLALYCAAGGVSKSRIADVLEIGGLSVHSTAKCSRLDASQRQRLVIAAALLGDPAALLLDEPHGLDEHGMAWFHALLRAYASQGRTVLVAASGPEALTGTVDHVIVLRRDEETGRSRVVASRSAAEVFDTRRASVVIARSPQAARLAALLEDQGAQLAPAGAGALEVRGLDRARIGELAHSAGICLHELAEVVQDDVFGWQAVPRQKAGGSAGSAAGEGDEGGETSAASAAPVEDGGAAEAAHPVVRAWRSGVRLVTDAQAARPGEGETADAVVATVATVPEASAAQRTAEPVDAVLSAPPRQTRDEEAQAPEPVQPVPDAASETEGQEQPPVPFTVLAPWKAAVSTGERTPRDEPDERPVTTPAPIAPEGKNPQPPETVPWYAAPSVVDTAGGPGGAGTDERASSGFAPGSNVAVTPRTAPVQGSGNAGPTPFTTSAHESERGSTTPPTPFTTTAHTADAAAAEHSGAAAGPTPFTTAAHAADAAVADRSGATAGPTPFTTSTHTSATTSTHTSAAPAASTPTSADVPSAPTTPTPKEAQA